MRHLQLKLGESVNGRVEEVISPREIIISFEGELLRVHNETRRALRRGDAVTLLVKAIDPLRFQLMPERLEQRRMGKLDLSI